MTVLGAVALALTIPFMWWWRFCPAAQDERWAKIAVAVVVTGWTLGPPLWFTYEHHKLISDADKQNCRKRVEQYKMGQDVARAFWVAVVAMIVATLVGR